MTQKGKEFERETAALAGGPKEKPYGRRVPRSGAFGTTEGVSKFIGDARWMLPWVADATGKPIVISIECKHGYSEEGQKRKSLRLQRDWFDKHLAQCEAANNIPMFAMKFKFTKENGISKFVLIPFPSMERLINYADNTYLELQELKEENKKLKAENAKLKKGK